MQKKVNYSYLTWAIRSFLPWLWILDTSWMEDTKIVKFLEIWTTLTFFVFWTKRFHSGLVWHGYWVVTHSKSETSAKKYTNKGFLIQSNLAWKCTVLRKRERFLTASIHTKAERGNLLPSSFNFCHFHKDFNGYTFILAVCVTFWPAV